MEIVMKQLSCKSVKADHNLKKVSYVLESNKVTFANGISGRLIRDLLFKNKKQTKGYIYVDPQGYKRDIGYLGNNFKKEIQSNTFEEEVNISGSVSPITAGGHVSTTGRRMISNIGSEDDTGVWTWAWLLTNV
jgi:hypothetical protein